jgi:hypothetical protein
LTKIATKLGVELHEVRDVFDVDEDGVHVLPVPGRFADTKKAATVEVGTLIIAGRQAIGADETGWTSQDIVRGAADAKGVLDEGNFSKAITALESRGIRLRKSSGRGREAKMNDRGFAAAGELVRRLAPQE